ncbi:MAG: hypothetical protein H8E13_21010, partial [Actinobacteria bacterium]|nr:hypothetical protein [Actinomycetota bacterium]
VIGKIDSVNITTIGEESLFLYYFIDSDVPIASSEDIGSKGDYKVVIIETDELGIPNIAGSYKINICNSLILFLGIIGFGLAIAGFGKAVEVPKETKEKEGKPEETKVEEGIDEDELESYEEEKKVLKKKKCPNCGSTIEITTDKRPLNIRCPNCNKGFKLKAKVEEGITEIVVCSKCGKSVPVFGNANMVNCKCGNNIMVEE